MEALAGVAEAQIEASAGTVTGAAVTDPIPLLKGRKLKSEKSKIMIGSDETLQNNDICNV